MLDMRPTLPRIERIVTVVTSLIAHHGNVLTETQMQRLGRIVDECEEIAVLRFSGLNIDTVTHIIFLFHALYEEAQRSHRLVRDTALRQQFQTMGLHGMYRVHSPSLPPSPNGTLACCVVCMDAEPTVNTSTMCKHDPVVCAECAARLTVCPTCRMEGTGASK